MGAGLNQLVKRPLLGRRNGPYHPACRLCSSTSMEVSREIRSGSGSGSPAALGSDRCLQTAGWSGDGRKNSARQAWWQDERPVDTGGCRPPGYLDRPNGRCRIWFATGTDGSGNEHGNWRWSVSGVKHEPLRLFHGCSFRSPLRRCVMRGDSHAETEPSWATETIPFRHLVLLPYHYAPIALICSLTNCQRPPYHHCAFRAFGTSDMVPTAPDGPLGERPRPAVHG